MVSAKARVLKRGVAELKGEDLCLHLVLSGRARVERDAHHHILVEDGFLLQNPGTRHAVRASGTPIISLCLPMSIVRGEHFEECLTPHDYGVHRAVSRFIDSLGRCGSAERERHSHEIVEALVHARDGSSQQYYLAPRDDAKGRRAQMKIAREYILANLGRPFGVPEVAAHLGLSPFHFHRVFTQWHGMTPGGYIQQERIRRACRRMVLKDETIAATANSSGFLSPTSFAGAFRSIIGMSPRQFRAEAVRYHAELAFFRQSS